MRITVDVPASEECLAALLEGLVQLNCELLAAHPLPPLYTSGVRYQAEVGTENWLTCAQVYAGGWGDCEDLGAWRAAELRIRGDYAIAVPARAGRTRDGRRQWHVRVRRADGTIEDPSRVLGMGARHARVQAR